MPFASRKRFTWRCRTRSIELGERTILMGIVNVTPDSFSDGGSFFEPGPALHHALRLLDEGADILDLGGESTRPGASPISAQQEQARILPVLAAILRERPDALLSVDTYHAETARESLQRGAEIVNDVSGLTWDPGMAAVLAEFPAGIVLMHARGRPSEWASLPSLQPAQVLPLVRRGLAQSLHLAAAAGVANPSIVLDPGFGFGKRGDENFALHAQLAELHQLGLPLLAGTSRKRFLTAHLPQPTHADRELASAASNVAAILGGAHLLRVHDVAAARIAASVADAILAAQSPPLEP